MNADRLFPIACILCLLGCSEPQQPVSTTATTATGVDAFRGEQGNHASHAIFEKRILPIFQSSQPSSCTECHLSGVELKDYIRPTQQETFVALNQAGLINKTTPDDSKILQFISRKSEQANLVTAKVRQQEYEAFRAWILEAVRDPELVKLQNSVTPIGPQIPLEVVRHARHDRVLASFVDNIWTEIGRCAACHSPDRNQKQVKEHGEDVSWITLDDPQATLNYMIESDLINTESPEDSLLLLKPTMQVEHGGGQKMVVGDRSYKQFRRFIDVGDDGDFIALRWELTGLGVLVLRRGSVVIWLKIEGVPAKFDKLLLQVDLYQKNDSGWTEFRVATSDRPVFGKGNLWKHSLSLTAPRDSERSEQIESQQLPPGQYLARIYIDQQHKLQEDFTAELNEEDLVGQIEFESKWPAGYGRMTVVQFPE